MNGPNQPDARDPRPVLSISIDYAGARDTPRNRTAGARPGFGWMLLIAAGWVVAGVIVIVGLAMAIAGIADSEIVGWLAGPALLLMFTSIAILLRNLRAHRAMAVLAYVEQAVRLNLPLPRMLRAAEQGERGRVRGGLARVREQMEDGTPVATSLGLALHGLPWRAQGLVAAGERSARLPQALHRVLAQWHGRERAGVRPDPSTSILLHWYPLLLLVGVFGTGSMFLVFVMPKYRALLSDFAVPLPPVTAWVIQSSEWFLWIAFPIIAALLLVQLGRLMGEVVMPRLWRHNPFDAVAGWLAWHLPPFRGLARGRALADACHVIADALDAGHTLDRAIGEASELPVNDVLRRRLRRWADGVLGGAPAGEAARAAGMPPMVAGMLGPAASATGRIGDAMRFLARYYDARFSRAAAILRGAAVPMLTIAGGVLVVALGLAMFQPLIAMMDHLANDWPGAR